ncbi:MAG: c-type cytochrome [Ignavibacteria bacterium]|nr:c-type cytochrome [Ignavibacteria bacterium]
MKSNFIIRRMMKFFRCTLKLTAAGFFAVVIFAGQAMSQTAPAAGGESDMQLIILIAVMIALLHAVFIPLLFPEKTPEELALAENVKKEKSILAVITDKISGLKPLDEEKELLMSDDYDGIRELDNNVPPWFNILFYSTIVIAIIYMLNYHVFKTGKLPFEEYSDEIYAAELKRDELIRTGAFINEESVELVSDPESLDMGKKIFMANCLPCHGSNAEGTVGPNLTDQYWIHGGGIKNIFKTVKYGVPVKGMISWQNVLNPKGIQQVSSYVITLTGTNPPNAKAPEGNIYTESTDTTALRNDSLKKTDSVKVSITDTLKNSALNKDTLKK